MTSATSASACSTARRGSSTKAAWISVQRLRKFAESFSGNSGVGLPMSAGFPVVPSRFSKSLATSFVEVGRSLFLSSSAISIVGSSVSTFIGFPPSVLLVVLCPIGLQLASAFLTRSQFRLRFAFATKLADSPLIFRSEFFLQRSRTPPLPKEKSSHGDHDHDEDQKQYCRRIHMLFLALRIWGANSKKNSQLPARLRSSKNRILRKFPEACFPD